MGRRKETGDKTGPTSTPAAPKDLIDFHIRWREFRPAAINLAARDGIPGQERETLDWLIKLADRIGVSDLEQP